MIDFRGKKVQVQMITAIAMRAGTITYSDEFGIELKTRVVGNAQTNVMRYYIPWTSIVYLSLGTKIQVKEQYDEHQ